MLNRPTFGGHISQGRAIRVYGVVNLYLTFLDDLFEVYWVGIQSESRIGRICNTADYLSILE